MKDMSISQEDPGADHPSTLPVAIPHGFSQGEALMRIAQYVAAQLHAGLTEREITHRLHGYQRTEGE